MGTEAAPLTNASIYLVHDDCDYLVHAYRTNWWEAAGATACLQKGVIEVQGHWHSHGVPRTAWSLVSNAAPRELPGGPGDSSLVAQIVLVEECRGWEVGDRVVVRQVLDRTDAIVNTMGRVGAERTLTAVSHDGDGRACWITLDADVRVRAVHPASEVHDKQA